MLIAGCVLFLVVRVLILLSAVDHFDCISGGEYALVDYAKNIGPEPMVNLPPHLWGSKATVYSLLPFVWMGMEDTVALRFSALILSWLGFMALVYLAVRYAGAAQGAILAILLIFPPPAFMRWTLMRYGAYPESCAMLGVAFLLWVAATSRGKPWFLFFAGVGLGLSQSMSPTTIFASMAFCLLTPLLIRGRRLVGTISYYGGVLAGLLPIFIALAWQGLDMEYKPTPTWEAGSVFGLLQIPQWSNISEVWTLFVSAFDGVFSGSVQFIALAVALWWSLLSGIFLRKSGLLWRLALPLTVLLALGSLMIFSSSISVEISLRHLLWLVPVSHFAVALAAGDGVLRWPKNRYLRWIKPLVLAVQVALLCLFVPSGVAGVAALIQPDEMGILFRFRGGSYHQAGIGSILGEEIQYVSCYLKEGKPRFHNHHFRQGLHFVFPMNNASGSCLRTKPTLPEMQHLDRLDDFVDDVEAEEDPLRPVNSVEEYPSLPTWVRQWHEAQLL